MRTPQVLLVRSLLSILRSFAVQLTPRAVICSYDNIRTRWQGTRACLATQHAHESTAENTQCPLRDRNVVVEAHRVLIEVQRSDYLQYTTLTPAYNRVSIQPNTHAFLPAMTIPDPLPPPGAPLYRAIVHLQVFHQLDFSIYTLATMSFSKKSHRKKKNKKKKQKDQGRRLKLYRPLNKNPPPISAQFPPGLSPKISNARGPKRRAG